MAKVTVVLSVATRTFPAGTEVGDYHVEIEKAGGEKIFLDQASTVFAFDDVAAGDYVARAWRNGAGGAVLGEVVSQSFVVTPTDMQVEVPIGLAISMS